MTGWAIAGLLYGAFCWGIIWYPYRLLEIQGIRGIAASFYTYGLTLLVVAVIYRNSAKDFWQSCVHSPASVLSLCLVAGITNISYVLAVIDGEVMRVMLLFYLSPLWTLLLAHFWLKESITVRHIGIIALALCGAFIMLWQTETSSPVSHADWLGLLAGLGFSFTNVLTRRSTQLSLEVKSASVWLGVFMLAGVLLMLPSQSASLALDRLDMQSMLWIGMIAVLLMTAVLFVQFGVSHLRATQASVIFLFELVVAALAAYFLTNERMTLQEWVGGGLILLAALASAMQSHD